LNQTAPEKTSIADLHDLGRAFNAMTTSLRQADQLKTGFIADVSHELRTPLTALKGTIETLQDGAVDDLAVRDRFLASMAAETERLIRLVNDLLTLTRADAGALTSNSSRSTSASWSAPALTTWRPWPGSGASAAPRRGGG
jgi:two-component system phosphate regulon sensor histidine kinase PhoR